MPQRFIQGWHDFFAEKFEGVDTSLFIIPIMRGHNQRAKITGFFHHTVNLADHFIRITGDDLFVAMKGEATDGHAYVDTAFAAGAAGAIVSTPVAGPHVLVEDSFAALQALGVAARARVSAGIVGVRAGSG